MLWHIIGGPNSFKYFKTFGILMITLRIWMDLCKTQAQNVKSKTVIQRNNQPCIFKKVQTNPNLNKTITLLKNVKSKQSFSGNRK